MSTPTQDRTQELGQAIYLAELRSHEIHMKYIYGLRWGGLALSALTIVIGAVMVFMGLQGSFNWAIDAPASIGAKITNASPGIVFATAGMLIGFLVVTRSPAGYRTGGADASGRYIGPPTEPPPPPPPRSRNILG